MTTSSSECEFSVLVRGGGIAGRTLAMLLAHDGLDVALVERPMAIDGSKDPRAYALNAPSVQLLKDLRVWPEDKACAVYDMQIMGDAGGRLDFSAWRQHVDVLTHIVPAVAIEEALDQALRYQSRVTRFKTDDGKRLPHAPLVAICEGRDSQTREQFGIEMKEVPYGHTAIAARVVCENGHGHIARQWFNHDVLALLPLVSDDDKEVSLVWSVPDERAAELLALPVADFEAQLRDATHNVLGELRLQTSRASWPLRFARAQRWIAHGGADKDMHTQGQVAVLVGDAAHAMHPLAGQGLNVGLGDVIALAKVLREAPDWRAVNDEKLLRPYERARKAAFAKVGGTCDAIFHMYMGTSSALRVARNWGMGAVNAVGPVKRWLVGQARES